MIVNEFTNKSIFDSDCQTKAVPVNKVGVMGAGLARRFKAHYPGLYFQYQRACHMKRFDIDNFYLFNIPDSTEKILCIPTKEHWLNDSKIELIEDSLRAISIRYNELGITSLAIPGLGCGCGHLKWDDVYPVIKKYLDPIDLKVDIYVPYGEHNAYSSHWP